jgi:hypothetical protein
MTVHLIKPADLANKPEAAVALATVNDKLRSRRPSKPTASGRLTPAELLRFVSKKPTFVQFASFEQIV